MATSSEEVDFYQGKTLGELGREAVWFLLHTAFAVLALAVVLGAGMLLHIAPEMLEPKLIGTLLAFAFPLAAGFLIARGQQDEVAKYVWISGLILFAIVCVWVLDLPTGNGLCDHCGAVDKLWRTFFDITHGSGLMGGDGLMVGSWIPLALFGYSAGAGLAIREPEVAAE